MVLIEFTLSDLCVSAVKDRSSRLSAIIKSDLMYNYPVFMSFPSAQRLDPSAFLYLNMVQQWTEDFLR
ncbi:MAG TPA: hypothetical protein PLV78_12075, partial [Deltaproteobacteria bacterium]|nr:hypothetical protein [Deltaproteobacteria bacterium]